MFKVGQVYMRKGSKEKVIVVSTHRHTVDGHIYMRYDYVNREGVVSATDCMFINSSLAPEWILQRKRNLPEWW
jgi:hypothetical protein